MCTAIVTAIRPCFIKQITPAQQDPQATNNLYRKCLTNAVSLLQGHSTRDYAHVPPPSNRCNLYTVLITGNVLITVENTFTHSLRYSTQEY